MGFHVNPPANVKPHFSNVKYSHHIMVYRNGNISCSGGGVRERSSYQGKGISSGKCKALLIKP